MSRINRRKFLKNATLTAVAATAGGVCGPVMAALDSRMVSRTTGKVKAGSPSTCRQCFARCGIIGYMQYGRLIYIGGNPNHPNNRGRLCAKGLSGVQAQYDPDRILVPMKRTGPRGSGSFQEITWDQALNELAGKLKELRDAGTPEGFVIHSQRDVTINGVVRRFADAYGTPNCLNHVDLGGPAKAAALRDATGVSVDVGDVAHTQYILSFGSNPYEAHILRTSFAQRIAEGRTERIYGGRAHNVAKMVVFDSRLSQTAGRADEWIPIKPGTDGIVALAMCNVILQENLQDSAFIRDWTNVTEQQLKEHLAQYTPELAESVSTVPADTIRRIAIELGSTYSATTLSAGGANKHANGTQNERAILLLNAITGNIEKAGGLCLARTLKLEEPKPYPPQADPTGSLADPAAYPMAKHEAVEQVLPAIAAGKAQVGVYMTYRHNPVHASPQSKVMEEILKDTSKIPYFVAVDSVMSESTALADLILPEATYLESWGLESPPSLELMPFISLRRPLVQPAGQARTLPDVLIDLAHRVGSGMEKYFNFESYENYLDKVVSEIPGLTAAGGMDYLIKNGFWTDETVKPLGENPVTRTFYTESGKLEIASPRFEAAGAGLLPVYEPIEQHKSMAEGQFHFITYQVAVHTHSYTANCMFLSEIAHHNRLLIHKEVAHKMGIQSGDNVRVSSSVGDIDVEVRTTQGIHPQVLALSDGVGHWAMGRVAKGAPFRSGNPETTLIWWGKRDGIGVHPNTIIPAKGDRLAGRQCWMDTIVTLSKV